MSKVLRKIKLNLRKAWIWFLTPFFNFWMRKIVLPREERIKKRILKNPRLMNWVSQISIALVNNGTYAPLIKAKREKKNKLNRKKRAPSMKVAN